ncbi:serine O-acetyltransferase [bacterium]|jgi:serine O-acetyltransferase|nr:serine O-acetyltransferase [bacterium]
MLNIIKTIKERDPAARNVFEIVLTYSGFHAVVFYRFAHFLYKLKVPFIPRFISQFAKFITGIEIHPGAEISRGFFIDHGMGVVIGETAVIGENCTLFQGVTLGGTGKEQGKRHPTLGKNVVIGAGAKVLGNITIGDNSYVGANAVVLKDVPPESTVVGIPGTVVKEKGKKVAGINLDHIHLPDPIAERLSALQKEIDHIEKEIKDYNNFKIRNSNK